MGYRICRAIIIGFWPLIGLELVLAAVGLIVGFGTPEGTAVILALILVPQAGVMGVVGWHDTRKRLLAEFGPGFAEMMELNR